MNEKKYPYVEEYYHPRLTPTSTLYPPGNIVAVFKDENGKVHEEEILFLTMFEVVLYKRMVIGPDNVDAQSVIEVSRHYEIQGVQIVCGAFHSCELGRDNEFVAYCQRGEAETIWGPTAQEDGPDTPTRPKRPGPFTNPN